MAATVAGMRGAASRSSVVMPRRTSVAAPAGQARTPQSRPMQEPVRTSTTRTSPIRQVTGANWAKAVETTSVNSPWAQATPAIGPTVKASSMTGTSSAA